MLSVIIPTRRRWHMLLPTLDALAARDELEGDFEIVVVVDGPGPPAPEAISESAGAIRMIEQPHSGLAAARNRGAAEANGEVLVFLDDDVRVGAEFLAAIEAKMQCGADVVLTAIVVHDDTDNLVSRSARAASQESIEALTEGDFVFDRMQFAATAIRAGWFESLDGFDESFTADGAYGNEDIEFGHRLLTAGARVAFAPEATATTTQPVEPALLLQRAVDIGRNDVRLARKHPELAAALFERKFIHSRIHRKVGRAVLRAPWIVRLDFPLRWIAGRAVMTGRSDRLASRLWFTARAVRYWRGVADAGGAGIARRRT